MEGEEIWSSLSPAPGSIEGLVTGGGDGSTLTEWLMNDWIGPLSAFAIQCHEDIGDALVASWIALRAWFRVLLLFGNPLLRLLLEIWRIVLPYLKKLAICIVNHLKEQEPEVLAAYALFITSCIGLILLRRLLLRLHVWDRLRNYCKKKVAAVEAQYVKATNRLRQYSRRAAEALPHVFFVLASCLMMWLFPTFVHRVAQELAFDIINLYIPAFSTFLLLHQQESAHPTTPAATKKVKAERLKEWLSYWVVAAVIMATKSLIDLLWIRWLFNFLPWGAEVVLFLAIWLHLPQGGGRIIREYLLPLLRKDLGFLLRFQSKRDAFIEGVAKVAVFTRLISKATSDRLVRQVDEIFLIVPAAVLTLSPFAGWGVLLISLLYPTYATVRAMRDPFLPNPWLRYWVVYALSHLLLKVIPLWSALQMWYYVWLLLPHFDGLPLALDGRDRMFDFMIKLWQEQTKADRRRKGSLVPPSSDRSGEEEQKAGEPSISSGGRSSISSRNQRKGSLGGQEGASPARAGASSSSSTSSRAGETLSDGKAEEGEEEGTSTSSSTLLADSQAITLRRRPAAAAAAAATTTISSVKAGGPS